MPSQALTVQRIGCELCASYCILAYPLRRICKGGDDRKEKKYPWRTHSRLLHEPSFTSAIGRFPLQTGSSLSLQEHVSQNLLLVLHKKNDRKSIGNVASFPSVRLLSFKHHPRATSESKSSPRYSQCTIDLMQTPCPWPGI